MASGREIKGLGDNIEIITKRGRILGTVPVKEIGGRLFSGRPVTFVCYERSVPLIPEDNPPHVETARIITFGEELFFRARGGVLVLGDDDDASKINSIRCFTPVSE